MSGVRFLGGVGMFFPSSHQPGSGAHSVSYAMGGAFPQG